MLPEGRTYIPPPHFGVSGGIAYGNRALSEGMGLLRKPFSFCVKRNKKRKDVTAMAIYHLEAKVISRGTGRSAVAASAYLSCSKILNDYDDVQHDFTRKQGLVWE